MVVLGIVEDIIRRHIKYQKANIKNEEALRAGFFNGSQFGVLSQEYKNMRRPRGERGFLTDIFEKGMREKLGNRG